jgi:hypothetical protein
MPVQTILGDIEFAADKPLDIRRIEIPLQGAIPFGAPLKVFGDGIPKIFGMRNAFGIGRLVFVERAQLKFHRSESNLFRGQFNGT